MTTHAEQRLILHEQLFDLVADVAVILNSTLSCRTD